MKYELRSHSQPPLGLFQPVSTDTTLKNDTSLSVNTSTARHKPRSLCPKSTPGTIHVCHNSVQQLSSLTHSFTLSHCCTLGQLTQFGLIPEPATLSHLTGDRASPQLCDSPPVLVLNGCTIPRLRVGPLSRLGALCLSVRVSQLSRLRALSVRGCPLSRLGALSSEQQLRVQLALGDVVERLLDPLEEQLPARHYLLQSLAGRLVLPLQQLQSRQLTKTNR